MDWTTYQETTGKRIQAGMKRLLANIENPTLQQIEEAERVATARVKANSRKRACREAMADLGMTRVRGNLGGVYYE